MSNKYYFCTMESNRQKKVATVIQKDLVEVLQGAAKDGMKGVIISVTKVSVTTDLSQAKVAISIFPGTNKEEIMKGIVSNTPLIRHELSQRTKHQLRRMPNLHFFLDDSLDYIETIDNSLQGNVDNPIEHPEILDKRKKR